MSVLAQAVIALFREIGALLGDVIAAEVAGKPLRMEQVFPGTLLNTIQKGIGDARAAVRYGATTEDPEP